MPILPDIEEPEDHGLEARTRAVLDRASRAVTGTAPVTARLVIFLLVAAGAASMAPSPWAQVAVLAMIGVTIEAVARRR